MQAGYRPGQELAMSAAKIPSIRNRMREQEILAFELTGPVGAKKDVTLRRQQPQGYRRPGTRLSALRRTGKFAQRVMHSLAHIDPTGVTF
jgi:hypothetical protein